MPDEKEVDEALLKWKMDTAKETDEQEEAASTDAHLKLQKRVADEEKRRSGK